MNRGSVLVWLRPNGTMVANASRAMLLKKALGFILNFEVSIGGKPFYQQRGLHDP
jgi:hypothetical protein